MMESTNTKTSTIKFIENDGTWSNGDHTYLKYKLHLNNGEKPEFLAKSQSTIDKLNVGDEVSYQYKKAGQNFAKIVKEFNQTKVKQMETKFKQSSNEIGTDDAAGVAASAAAIVFIVCYGGILSGSGRSVSSSSSIIWVNFSCVLFVFCFNFGFCF